MTRFQVMPHPVTGWMVVLNGTQVTSEGKVSRRAAIVFVDNFVEKEDAQELCDALNKLRTYYIPKDA